MVYISSGYKDTKKNRDEDRIINLSIRLIRYSFEEIFMESCIDTSPYIEING